MAADNVIRCGNCNEPYDGDDLCDRCANPLDRPIKEPQLLVGIERALAARDFTAVVALIKHLASLNPTKAQEVYDTIKVGLAIAAEENGGA